MSTATNEASLKDFVVDSGLIVRYEFTEPEKFLRAWMSVSVADYPLEYHAWESGGERVEQIAPEELFSPKSLNTAWGKPIVLAHPEDAITKDNYGLLKPRGSTMTDYLNTENVLTILGVIQDAEAIEAVLSGVDRVSAGYQRQLENIGGKLWQKDRNYNHFALCDNPRAGDNCKLHLIADSRDRINDQLKGKVTFQIPFIHPKIATNNVAMTTKKLTIVNDAYDVPEAVFNHVTSLNNSIQALENEKTYYTSQMAALQGEQDNLKGQLKQLTDSKVSLEGQVQGLQLQLDSAPKADAIAKEAQERVETWAVVLPAFVADAKKENKTYTPDYSLDSVAVKKLYLKQFHPDKFAEWNLDTQPDLFVNGVWLGLAPKPSVIPPVDQTDDQTIRDATNALLSQITDSETTQPGTNYREQYQKRIEAGNKN